MNLKMVAICLYIMFIYWISLHVPVLHTLFFPTLGAFSFLFVSRSLRYSEIRTIIHGAFISSIVGSLLFYIYPGGVALFINLMITIWLINKFKWNAPPILAVSILPFFAQPLHIWTVPLSVWASLLGLMIIIYLAEVLERRFVPLLSLFAKKQDAARIQET